MGINICNPRHSVQKKKDELLDSIKHVSILEGIVSDLLPPIRRYVRRVGLGSPLKQNSIIIFRKPQYITEMIDSQAISPVGHGFKIRLLKNTYANFPDAESWIGLIMLVEL